MDFTFRQLQYFIAAAEEGTLSGAAERLHVSASALSAAITELETSLDAQLCVRRKARGLSLTPSGVEVLEQARVVVRAASEIQFTSLGSGGQFVGPVTIGSYLTLSPTVVPKIFHDFGTLHGRIHLNVVEGSRDELIARLETGELDVAIVFDTRDSLGLNRVHLYDLPPHVILPASHPLADKTDVSLADLTDESLILYDVEPSPQWTVGMFSRQNLTPRVRHKSRSFETVRGLVARGLGYSILVQRPVVQQSYEGLPIVVKEIREPRPEFAVVMIWPEGITLSPRVRALVEFAQQLDWTSPEAHL